MKKTVALLLGVLFIFLVAGCKSKSTEQVNKRSETAQRVEKNAEDQTALEEEFVEEPEEEEEEEDFDKSKEKLVPELISGGMPEYPSGIQPPNLVGRVILQLKVSPNGAVEDVQVVSVSYEDFKEPAVNAAKSWRFKPPGIETELRASFLFDPEGVKVSITPLPEEDREGSEI